MRCVTCGKGVPPCVSAWTRCSFCGECALCVVHRLPESHGCPLAKTGRFEELRQKQAKELGAQPRDGRGL